MRVKVETFHHHHVGILLLLLYAVIAVRATGRFGKYVNCEVRFICFISRRRLLWQKYHENCYSNFFTQIFSDNSAACK